MDSVYLETKRVRRFFKGLIILIRLGVSQVVVSGDPLQNVVDVTKELEIRCDGVEQCEDKRACHLGDYGGAPPKSRGYLGGGYHSQSSRPIHAAIPTSEAGYAMHSSSTSVHTSQDSSHQPTSHRGCFECGDIGHLVRVCPRTRRGG
ncbi:hypothetical protein KY290_033591 [Solanum tuberosum]|uniref:CCHC-type domain-containing protein n=1 Tax=Solanum tuberosum TaxID=4113 RepID=A0ABQ7U1A6_SOLTU|nr:hypothetical protein KY285_032850 [Solanum tuberosum]KAH0740548.1 hypothetical protein KY290_033591 [Solanum tuberosum]